MKSVLKTFVMLLVSAQAFAFTELNQIEMNGNIQKLKSDIAKECGPEGSSTTLNKVISNSCPTVQKFLQMELCKRKSDMVLFFEGVMAPSNVSGVLHTFVGGLPKPDDLGGVLLFQMRSSIDQVSDTWARQVKNVPSKCVTGNLKAQMREYAKPLRVELGQTRLSVALPTLQRL